MPDAPTIPISETLGADLVRRARLAVALHLQMVLSGAPVLGDEAADERWLARPTAPAAEGER